MNLLRRFRADDRGNMVILAAFTIPVVLAGAGAAISYSDASAVRSDVQAALDAAVVGGAALDVAQSSDRIATAQTVFAANLAKSTAAQTAGVTASFTFATASGSNEPTVSGTATGSFRNPFGGLIGPATYEIGARASATKQAIPLCVLGLNGLDNGAMDMNGNATLAASSCAVQANSNSASGLTQEGKPNATAKVFGVSGGHKGNNFSPPPVDGAAAVSDPYASIPFPPYDDCSKGGHGTDVKADTTLSPGTYCGGIHVFGNGAKVTLQPGVYVMVDGPLWIDADSVVTGDKVMIAFTGKGSTLQVWGTATLNVTSPTSGPYMNMQFMQDRFDVNSRGLWVSISGNTNVRYDGVAYFPTQNFWVFGDATLNANSPSLAIVADKVWFQGNAQANINNDNTRKLPVNVPKTAFGARLIK